MGIPSTSKQKLPFGQSYLRKCLENGRTKPALRRSKFPRILLGVTVTVIHFACSWASLAFTWEIRIRILPFLAGYFWSAIDRRESGKFRRTKIERFLKGQSFQNKGLQFSLLCLYGLPAHSIRKERKVSSLIAYYASSAARPSRHVNVNIIERIQVTNTIEHIQVESLETKPKFYLQYCTDQPTRIPSQSRLWCFVSVRG